MGRYVPLRLEDFENVLGPMGYVHKDSLYGSIEDVYIKRVGRVDVVVYTTVIGNRVRDSGKDAIRVVLISPDYGCMLSGTKRVNRVGTSPYDIMARVKERVIQMERLAEIISFLWINKIEVKDISPDVLKDTFVVVNRVEDKKTKSGKNAVEVEMVSNIVVRTGDDLRMVKIITSYLYDNDGWKSGFDIKPEEGMEFAIVKAEEIRVDLSTKSAVIVYLGKYGYCLDGVKLIYSKNFFNMLMEQEDKELAEKDRRYSH